MKITLKIIALIMAISLLAGCNTVEGFGKDMQQGGQSLQRDANQNK